MSTRSAARKTESWKDLLYSEGFIVQTAKFANGTTGRGLLVKKQFEAQVFLLSYWGRGVQLKSPTLTKLWKFRREKTQCSLALPMRRVLAWRGLLTTRTNQLPPTFE